MNTPFDELVDYKNKIVNAIESSQEVIDLLVGKQNVDLDSDAAYEVCNKQILDYSFVVDTQLTENNLILIDIETRSRPNYTYKNITVFIQIICHKDSMKLKGFKGVKGNRRDNLARQIANLLDGRKDFGIGKLVFTDCYVVSVPNPYSSLMVTFEVPNFVKGGNGNVG